MNVASKPARVSVVIPCLNERDMIGRCLESVLEQTYPQQRIEILIADGGSTDGTLAVIEQFAACHPQADIRLVENPDRIQSAGCNQAIAVSRGDVIVRLDAHAEYDRNYIARSVAALSATGAANVGGAARPVHKTFFQRCLAAALESRASMGGAPYWRKEHQGWVDTVWNGAFPRSTFEEVGLYDPRARTNEDAELNLRITRAGKRIYLCRDVIAHYYPRRSLFALGRQYLRYGQGRARTVLKHHALQSYRPLAPFSLVSALLLLGLLAPFSTGTRTLLSILVCTYALGILVESVRIGWKRGLEVIPVAFLILPTMHLAHGTGFLLGLLRYGLRPDWPSAPLLLPPRPSSPPQRVRLVADRRSPSPEPP
jgi:glycosyltransferase involved in cell wall biosynthesis